MYIPQFHHLSWVPFTFWFCSLYFIARVCFFQEDSSRQVLISLGHYSKAVVLCTSLGEMSIILALITITLALIKPLVAQCVFIFLNPFCRVAQIKARFPLFHFSSFEWEHLKSDLLKVKSCNFIHLKILQLMVLVEVLPS